MFAAAERYTQREIKVLLLSEVQFIAKLNNKQV